MFQVWRCGLQICEWRVKFRRRVPFPMKEEILVFRANKVACLSPDDGRQAEYQKHLNEHGFAPSELWNLCN